MVSSLFGQLYGRGGLGWSDFRKAQKATAKLELSDEERKEINYRAELGVKCSAMEGEKECGYEGIVELRGEEILSEKACEKCGSKKLVVLPNQSRVRWDNEKADEEKDIEFTTNEVKIIKETIQKKGDEKELSLGDKELCDVADKFGIEIEDGE